LIPRIPACGAARRSDTCIVKIRLFPIAACLLALLTPAGAAEAKYKEESPLPKGWPEPGPFGEVTRKTYPAYRAAFTKEGGPNGAFMKLFGHIRRQEIPMTAPVEMKMDETGSKGLKMEQMAFLYQSPEVGKTGADGAEIEVRDVPAKETLSYAWQGARDAASTAKAREAIDAELAKQNLKAEEYRLLGYNSPFIPKAKQTHELQAVLK
jgi:hypothetical protein